jgi:flagellar basal body-associated protein FliL
LKKIVFKLLFFVYVNFVFSQTDLEEDLQNIELQYSLFTDIGLIRTQTKDNPSYLVFIDIDIGYDINDDVAAFVLTRNLYDLRDFLKDFFRSKYLEELFLEDEKNEIIKKELIEQINSNILNIDGAKMIIINRLDIMEM